MTERDYYWLSAAIFLLAVGTGLTARRVRKLRADVDFLTVVSEKQMGEPRV